MLVFVLAFQFVLTFPSLASAENLVVGAIAKKTDLVVPTVLPNGFSGYSATFTIEDLFQKISPRSIPKNDVSLVSTELSKAFVLKALSQILDLEVKRLNISTDSVEERVDYALEKILSVDLQSHMGCTNISFAQMPQEVRFNKLRILARKQNSSLFKVQWRYHGEQNLVLKNLASRFLDPWPALEVFGLGKNLNELRQRVREEVLRIQKRVVRERVYQTWVSIYKKRMKISNDVSATDLARTFSDVHIQKAFAQRWQQDVLVLEVKLDDLAGQVTPPTYDHECVVPFRSQPHYECTLSFDKALQSAHARQEREIRAPLETIGVSEAVVIRDRVRLELPEKIVSEAISATRGVCKNFKISVSRNTVHLDSQASEPAEQEGLFFIAQSHQAERAAMKMNPDIVLNQLLASPFVTLVTLPPSEQQALRYVFYLKPLSKPQLETLHVYDSRVEPRIRNFILNSREINHRIAAAQSMITEQYVIAQRRAPFKYGQLESLRINNTATHPEKWLPALIQVRDVGTFEEAFDY